MSDYRPIACGAYDQIELLAMRRVQVRVNYTDEQGLASFAEGAVIDTAIHDGAEFMLLETAAERLELRLDRILGIHDVHGVLVWEPLDTHDQTA